MLKLNLQQLQKALRSATEIQTLMQMDHSLGPVRRGMNFSIGGVEMYMQPELVSSLAKSRIAAEHAALAELGIELEAPK